MWQSDALNLIKDFKSPEWKCLETKFIKTFLVEQAQRAIKKTVSAMKLATKVKTLEGHRSHIK